MISFTLRKQVCYQENFWPGNCYLQGSGSTSLGMLIFIKLSKEELMSFYKKILESLRKTLGVAFVLAD